MYTLSQLLFYNAKLMYRSIIVMDFLGFSIFDKKYKKKSRNAATSEFIYHYLIINEVLIQNLLESRFLQFFFFFLRDICRKFKQQRMELNRGKFTLIENTKLL